MGRLFVYTEVVTAAQAVDMLSMGRMESERIHLKETGGRGTTVPY